MPADASWMGKRGLGHSTPRLEVWGYIIPREATYTALQSLWANKPRWALFFGREARFTHPYITGLFVGENPTLSTNYGKRKPKGGKASLGYRAIDREAEGFESPLFPTTLSLEQYDSSV